ncbi:MAG: hypothetical protein AB8G77_02260 [Rhodothermales bacterium]
MHVYVPECVNAQCMDVVLGQVFDQHGLLRSNKYTFDFEVCDDIDAAGIAMLDTLFICLGLEKCQIELALGNQLPQALNALLRLQLNTAPDSILNEAVTIEKGGIEQNLCIHRFNARNDKLWFKRIFNNWLAHELYASALVIAPQTQNFIGLIENISMHAGVPIASVVSAYDAEQEEVRLVLSDAGKGIPPNIRRVWKAAISDEVAIAKAIENGPLGDSEATGKEGGLGRLIKGIVDQQMGKVIITSGFGRLSCLSGTRSKIHVFEPTNAVYPGTMIEVVFSTNAMGFSSMMNEPTLKEAFVLR